MSRGWGLDEESEFQEAPKVRSHKSEEKSLSVSVWSVPEDCLVVRVKHPETKEPVQGANVVMMAETWDAPSIGKTTDEYGEAYFWHSELTLVVLGDPTADKWIIMADIPASEYGYIKSDFTLSISTTQGQLLQATLKHYKEVPTLYIKFTMKDVIGADLWASIITTVNNWILSWAGYTIVSTEGQGTNTITIKFKPPWSASSPFAITLTATALGVAALVILIVGIIAVLVVSKWTFGEWTAPIVGGIILLLLIPALAALVPKVKEEAPKVKEYIKEKVTPKKEVEYYI